MQDHAEINFQLDVGVTTSEITVSAAAPLLESETSSLGQVIEEKAITDLPPNARNFIQLAILGAGTRCQHGRVQRHLPVRRFSSEAIFSSLFAYYPTYKRNLTIHLAKHILKKLAS